MSALDQAFIRAYTQQGAGAGVSRDGPAGPVLPLSQALGDPPSRRTVRQPAPTSETVLAALSRPSAAATQPVATASEPEERRPRAGVKKKTRTNGATTTPPVPPPHFRTQPLSEPVEVPGGGQDNRLDGPHFTPVIRQEPVPAPPPPYVPPPAYVPPAAIDAPPPEPKQQYHIPAADQSAAQWHPKNQVERFNWPRICQRLAAAGGSQTDQLADGLTALVRQGRKIIAMTGCHAGDGATTVLLAAARRLADRGFRVAVVEANLGDPQLARRLGIIGRMGQSDVLTGRLPLEDAVVESEADRLAVLPLREPTSSTEPAPQAVVLAGAIAAMADHYDAVLVDLAPLEGPNSAQAALSAGLGRSVDAVVLVHDTRISRPEHLAEVQRRTADAGVVLAGVVENFAR